MNFINKLVAKINIVVLYNDIKTVLSLRSNTISDKILERYIVAILIISSLWLFDISIFNMSIKGILFLFITLMTAVTCIILISKAQIVPRKWNSNLDKWILGVFLLNLIVMFMKIMSKDYERKVYYEVELVALVLVMAYFILSCTTRSYRYYLKLLLVLAIVVYLGILIHFLWLPNFAKPFASLISNPQNLTAYTILISTVSSLLYCTTAEKKESVFYIAMSGISFFILFLSTNIIGICIIGVLFLLIPVIFVPTAALIKRTMHLFFLFFFILSNMSLVTNYTKWIKIDLTFDIMTSIYLDLFLSIVAFFYLQYWEKIPENIDPHRSIMKKLRKAYVFMLKLTGIIFLVILLAGNKLEKIPLSFSMTGFKNFVIKFQQCYTANNGTFDDALAEYGLLGFLLLIIICVLIVTMLERNYNKDNQSSVILTVIAIVFLVQSAFFSQQLITTPIYVIFLTFALFDNKTKRGQLQ